LIDCTCSGLQHLAAISRDSNLARIVNLTSNDVPLDLYGFVATQLGKMICKNPVYQGMKITRDFVKKPVMTLAYSVTEHGMTGQLMSFFKYDNEKKMYQKIDQPGIYLSGRNIKNLALIIIELIYKEHPKLKELLTYLQDMAECMSDLDLPVI
jgi:DNA-directed RNA polymerase